MPAITTLTARDIACLRAALAHVLQDPGGLADAARLELDDFAWLPDAAIDALIEMLAVADTVQVCIDIGRLERWRAARAHTRAEQLELAPLDPRD